MTFAAVALSQGSFFPGPSGWLAPLASMAYAAPAPTTGSAPQKDGTTAETTIAVGSDANSDARIKRRLAQLFASLDGLGGVHVEVSAGVVTLSGEVPSNAAHEQALQLARRVENVADVRDRITETRDLRKRLSQTLERVVGQILDFVAFLPLLIVAIAVVALFWWIAWRVAGSARFARQFRRNPFIRDLASQVVRVVFIGVGLLLALEILDATTLVGTVLGAAGVAGLAIGFALRDTVENYLASLLLSLRQPFARDDLVTIDGCEGRVVRLTARATVLMTLDGNHTRIPNANVFKAVIVNYTRNPKRRFQFDVGVDTEQNLAAAQELAATTLAQMDGVLDDPPPTCTVEQLGDSNVIVRVFGWVDQASADFNKVRSEAIRLVKGAFDRAGVVMPEPIYNLRFAQLPASVGAPSSSAPPAEQTPLEGARPTRTKPEHGKFAEPQRAIDIARRKDLDRQIAADRSASEEDLLNPQAAKE